VTESSGKDAGTIPVPLPELREKIAGANRLLKLAEDELDRAVQQLSPVLIGDKRMSSQALDTAFDKLRAARRTVSDLDDLLSGDG
jgi:hypothetical protein